MDSELNKLLNSALDSSLSTYYRRTALGQIGRLRKTTEVVNAVLKLINFVLKICLVTNTLAIRM